jgi:hypothetical protein
MTSATLPLAGTRVTSAIAADAGIARPIIAPDIHFIPCLSFLISVLRNGLAFSAPCQ